MNTLKNLAIILTVSAVCITSVRGQGFLNLDFESAYNLPGNPTENGTSVGMTNGLPGWTAFGGPNRLFNIYYVSNNFPGTSTAVELEGGSLALSGNLSVGLNLNGSISQTGLVPADAESLEFEASPASDLSVTLGGQGLSYSALSRGSSYTLYGVNIPNSMAGQLESLTFGVNGPAGEALLDNIEFSPTGVPEPGEWALIGVWVVLIGVSRRWLTAPSFVETSTEGRKTRLRFARSYAGQDA